MITQEDVFSTLHSSLDGLHTDFGVKKIGVFGSFAQGTQGPDSDIDLIVEFERPVGLRFMDLGERLQAILNRPVDMFTPAGINGIRNREVAETILRTVRYI